MKQLLLLARNHHLIEGGDSCKDGPIDYKMRPLIEIICTLHEPTAVAGAAGIRHGDAFERVTFFSSPKQIRQFAARLLEYADESETIAARCLASTAVSQARDDKE